MKTAACALLLTLPALAACSAASTPSPAPTDESPRAVPAPETPVPPSGPIPAPPPGATNPPAPAPAPPAPELAAALEEVVRTEQEFSRTSVARGTREAFLAFLAEDAVLFRPGPVPGRQAIEARPAGPGYLAWRPIHAEIAASADLGYTTGPYEARPAADAAEKSFGHYITVWKKQADGGWKAVVDGGTGTPAAYDGPEGSRVVPGAVAPGGTAGAQASARDALLGADRAFSTLSSGRGAQLAYLAQVTPDVRLYRNGSQPAVGKDAVGRVLGRKPPFVTWEPQAGDVSRAGDFGYTYGSYQIRDGGPDQPARPATYLRLWRRQPGKPWKVALEMVLPLPAPG
jgi:ketosteroid isomerase-like protein